MGPLDTPHNGTPGAPETGSVATPCQPWRIIAHRGCYLHLHTDPGELPVVLDEVRSIRPVVTVFGPLPCHLHGGCRRMYVVVLAPVPQPDPAASRPPADMSALAGSVRI